MAYQKKPMNPTIKALWLTALRSGEYQQAKGALYQVKENAFCCLGVLCDLHSKVNDAVWDTDFNDAEYFADDSALPQEVMDWAGVTQASGCYLEDPADGDTECNLAVINDHGADFQHIADIIEKHF